MKTTEVLDLDQKGKAGDLGLAGSLLLSHARSKWPLPGRRSALRKFRRRFLDRPFRVTTKFGFRFEGKLGDSVETEVAVHREFEPGLSRLLDGLAMRMESFVDVGCNVGYFTCLVASRGKAKVLAVDANPAVLAACRHNLEINGLTAHSVHAAVGEVNRETVLHVPRGRATRGTLGDLGSLKDCVDSVSVEMKRFSDLLNSQGFDRVDLVKIDIKGYESCLFKSINPDTARRCEVIVFEFSEANLAQCGRHRRDFNEIEWLEEFELYVMDETTGMLHRQTSISSVGQTAATLLLRRKVGPHNLPLQPWIV